MIYMIYEILNFLTLFLTFSLIYFRQIIFSYDRFALSHLIKLKSIEMQKIVP